jgi:hypothetical protein
LKEIATAFGYIRGINYNNPGYKEIGKVILKELAIDCTKLKGYRDITF